MSWRVSIRPVAESDLCSARMWYERQRPGLGDEFLLSMMNVFHRLEESPEQFPVYYKGFRRVLTERFPYKVFFSIEGSAVIVFRILHTARNHVHQLSENP